MYMILIWNKDKEIDWAKLAHIYYIENPAKNKNYFFRVSGIYANSFKIKESFSAVLLFIILYSLSSKILYYSNTIIII
jgi:hypothetical protein